MKKFILIAALSLFTGFSALAETEWYKVGTIDCTSGDDQTYTEYFGYNAEEGKSAPSQSGWSVWVTDPTEGTSQPTGTMTMTAKIISGWGTVPYGTEEQVTLFEGANLANIDTENGIDLANAVGVLPRCFGLELTVTMTVTGNNSAVIRLIRDTR